MKERKKVTVTMPIELYESVADLAKEDCRSVPNQIRQILWGYFAALAASDFAHGGKVTKTPPGVGER